MDSQKKYKVTQLVYYEAYQDVQQAILREKRIKRWKCQWKINLIEKDNPEWKDLYLDLVPRPGFLPTQE